MRTVETTIGEVPLITGKDELGLSGNVIVDFQRVPTGDEDICNSAFDPRLARLATICYYDTHDGRCMVVDDEDEWAMLRQFWTAYLLSQADDDKMIGFALLDYELPFVVRRSWHVGVEVPKDAVLTRARRRYSSTIVDLLDVWMCGMRDCYTSLDSLARFFGVGKKPIRGKRFHETWEKNQKAAVNYIVNNVVIMNGCAVEMGLTPRK